MPKIQRENILKRPILQDDSSVFTVESLSVSIVGDPQHY